ncbi:MAG: hypothetical protein HY303_17735 [Candidatus Wallbacteria bacterium]|nr:hypothetical protein [Candidatus Wallbacteria bacterium]
MNPTAATRTPMNLALTLALLVMPTGGCNVSLSLRGAGGQSGGLPTRTATAAPRKSTPGGLEQATYRPARSVKKPSARPGGTSLGSPGYNPSTRAADVPLQKSAPFSDTPAWQLASATDGRADDQAPADLAASVVAKDALRTPGNQR